MGFSLININHLHVDADTHAEDFLSQQLKLIFERIHTIMSAISDFAVKQTAFNARMESSIQGIGGDIAELNKKIQELQNSAGQISAEDQATLDDLQAKGEALAAKFEAMDALIPPATPTE